METCSCANVVEFKTSTKMVWPVQMKWSCSEVSAPTTLAEKDRSKNKSLQEPPSPVVSTKSFSRFSQLNKSTTKDTLTEEESYIKSPSEVKDMEEYVKEGVDRDQYNNKRN